MSTPAGSDKFFHSADPSTTLDSPVNNAADDGKTYCAVHPTVETSLRCNKCGRYMCVKCAVRTPVGYRCKECVHQQQDSYFTASTRDYAIGFAVSFVLSVPIAFILTRPEMGFFLVIILALPAGGLIGEAVFRAVSKRRGRYLWAVVAVGIVLGALVAGFPALQEIVAAYTAMNQQFGDRAAGQMGSILGQMFIGGLLPILIYIVMCAGTAIARLRYGK